MAMNPNYIDRTITEHAGLHADHRAKRNVPVRLAPYSTPCRSEANKVTGPGHTWEILVVAILATCSSYALRPLREILLDIIAFA